MTSNLRKVLLAFLAMVIAVTLVILIVRVTMLNQAVTDYDRAFNEMSQKAEANKKGIDEANKRLESAGQPTVAVPSATVSAAYPAADRTAGSCWPGRDRWAGRCTRSGGSTGRDGTDWCYGSTG